MIDKLSALIKSIPADKLERVARSVVHCLQRESLRPVIAARFVSECGADLNGVGDNASTPFQDAGPLLDSQARPPTQSGSGPAASRGHRPGGDQRPPGADPAETGPARPNEVSPATRQVKPTLPVLLGELTTIGQVGVSVSRVAGATAGVLAAVRRLHQLVWTQLSNDDGFR